MIKKMSFVICLLFAFLTPNFTYAVLAKEPNAKDCLEGVIDCGEEANELLGNENVDQDKSLDSSLKSGSLGFDLLKMVFALFFILALIYFLLKFLGKRNKLFQQASVLENVGGISVGPNKSIQIVRVGSKFYLVGVGENVELLHEIIDEDVKKDLLHKEEVHDMRASNFITSIFPKSNVNKKMPNQEQNNFKQSFANELQKLTTTRKRMIHLLKKDDKHE